MSNGNGESRDLRFETTLGRVLGVGVVASSACLAVGLVLALFSPGGSAEHLLLATGLVLLMATPAARVVVSAAVYTMRKDWLFTTLTLIVLLELVASLVAALHGQG
jgi:uncharacterized membrane protein